MRIYALLLATLASAVVGDLQTLHAQATQVLTPAGAAQNDGAASYGIGYQIGMNVGGGEITAEDISQSEFIKGFMDALSGKEPAIEEAAIQAAMEALGQKIMNRKLSENQKFLDDNKKKDGVQTTDTGLQYKVIKSGSGASPTATGQATVHYEGKKLNGQIFDSSLGRGQPATFPVNRVIPGWTEALLRMKVGDKWQLFIPSSLAYGENGSPPDPTGRQAIGPHEVLIFEVELLNVE